MSRLICLALFLLPLRCQAQHHVDVLKNTDSLEWKYDTEKRPELEGFPPFELHDGVLRISEKVAGLLNYPCDQENRHVVLEFKWGERTSSDLENTARRANASAGAGLVSLRESMSGDLLVPQKLGAAASKSKAYDDTVPNRRGAHTHSNSIESPFGHWNRLEIIARDHQLTVKLNGETVNEATFTNPLRPAVSLSPTFAELFVRRWDIFQPGTFSETWQPDTASTDTGYSTTGESILPRDYPLSPEESLAAWQIDGDYQLQLVAAEPLTCDPVDVSWDSQGRLFVAEMRDYPLPTEHGGYLSRIRLLTDTNGDGVMDEAITWADHLDHVQGLTPHREGFIATTRTAILYLADTDGDDRADHIEPLYHSNDPKHNQLQVSSPRRGLDNWIYLNNGLDLKQIYRDGSPDATLNISKSNIRIHPQNHAIEAVSGYGQFGATQDDFGRRFFSSNRNPIMMAVMPFKQGYEDIAPSGENSKVYPLELSHTTSVAHAGTHTAACGLAVYRGNAIPDLKGNLFVCEPTAQLVTRSRLMENGPSFRAERIGDKTDFIVSSDEWSRPVNLRNGPDGCLYLCDIYRRFIDHSRFFPEAFSKSHYMRAGFDHGRIYRLIPRDSSPPPAEPLPQSSEALVEELKSPNAWQRVHAQRLIVESGDKSVAPLLESLLDRSPLPETRVHAFGALLGLEALNERHFKTALGDPETGVAENALLAALPGQAEQEILDLARSRNDRASFLALIHVSQYQWRNEEALDHIHQLLHATKGGANSWNRKAILGGHQIDVGSILSRMLTSPVPPTGEPAQSDERLNMYREFSAAVAASSSTSQLDAILQAMESVTDQDHQLAIAKGISTGLPRSNFKTKNLAAFIASPPEQLTHSTNSLSQIVDLANELAQDESQSAVTRVAAIEIASQNDFASVLQRTSSLITPAQPSDVQTAAVRSLGRFSKNRKETAQFFFNQWKTLPPPTRREAINLLTGNNESAVLLMEQMKAGHISPSNMPPMKQWVYGRSQVPKIKSLAGELFGKTASSRNAVIEDYLPALSSHTPNHKNGANALQKGTCLACHRIGGKGTAVGPDLADVRAKPGVALLTDILDPNRAVEERWIAYSIELKDGTIATGLIDSEDAQSVTLKVPGGVTQTYARSDIETMASTETSLMPAGLEAALTPEDMVDLIAVLKAHRASN